VLFGLSRPLIGAHAANKAIPGKNDQSGIKGKHFRLCYVIIDGRGSKNWRSTQPSRLMLYFAQRRSGLMPVMRAEE